MAWTEKRVARLKQLWAEGRSANAIARELGNVTRNAVIGKVNRLGLSGQKRLRATNHSTPSVADARVRTGWFEETVAMLTELRLAGSSYPKIATALNHAFPSRQPAFTVSAVSKKASQLKLKPQNPVAQSVLPRSRVDYSLRKPTAPQRGRTFAEPFVSDTDVARSQRVAELEKERRAQQERPITILDLKDNMCRFPLGDPNDDDFTFCGKPIARSDEGMKKQRVPYCSAHKEVSTYLKPDPRKRQSTSERRRF